MKNESIKSYHIKLKILLNEYHLSGKPFCGINLKNNDLILNGNYFNHYVDNFKNNIKKKN